MISVDEIQSRIASLVDLNYDTSDIATDEYALRLKYINMAQNEWAETYDWQQLYKEYNMCVSTSTGNASIALPSDFRKLASYPKIVVDSTTDEYTEVRPQEWGQYLSTDKVIKIMGDPSGGYVMFVNGSLSSGASVFVPYYCSPQSLASPANVSMCPNADYIVQRAYALTLEGREDPRFPAAKAEAEKLLARLISSANTHGEAAAHGRVKTVEETKYSFRLGRD